MVCGSGLKMEAREGYFAKKPAGFQFRNFDCFLEVEAESGGRAGLQSSNGSMRRPSFPHSSAKGRTGPTKYMDLSNLEV